ELSSTDVQKIDNEISKIKFKSLKLTYNSLSSISNDTSINVHENFKNNKIDNDDHNYDYYVRATLLPNSSVFVIDINNNKIKKVRSDSLKAGPKLGFEDLKPFIPVAAWGKLIKRYKPWHSEQRAVTVLFINLEYPKNTSTENTND